MPSLVDELRQRRTDTRAAADEILTRAAGEQRDLSPDEFTAYQQRSGELREIDDRLEQLLADEVRELRAAAARPAGTEEPYPLGQWLTRAITSGAGAGAAFTPTEFPATFYDRLTATSVGLASGFAQITTTRDSVTIPRVTADPSASWVAEAGVISSTDLAADTVTATPRKLAGLQRVSFRRFRLGQWAGHDEQWIDRSLWADRAAEREIPPGTEVVAGFDGSFNGDCTAIVVATVDECPHIDVAALWERPDYARPDWQVPILDVEEAIRDACRRWQVREIVCDPFRWARTLQILEAEGLPVEAYPQSPQRMTPATTRFYEAVINGQMTHSGDRALARHVANAVLKADSRGTRIYKEHRHSTRRIDLAVAALMAFDRAAWLASRAAPMIYV